MNMNDHRKLGRKRTLHHKLKNALWVSDYLTDELPPEPASADYISKTVGVTDQWGMLANDQVGDCVVAAALHTEMVWVRNAGGVFAPTDEQALALYEQPDLGGFNPDDPDTDSGVDPVDMLDYWKANGIAGRPPIGGYVLCNPQRIDQVKQTINIFEAAMIGLGLPAVAQRWTDPLKRWDLPDGQELSGDWAPYSWGGHEIIGARFNPQGVDFASWGETWGMTWAFFLAYCDQIAACASQDQLDGTGKCPIGIDWPTLSKDLAAVSKA